MAKRRSFDEVWNSVRAKGSCRVVSSRNTVYTVTAEVMRDGRRALVGKPASGRVYIHQDCWGDDITCQRTRAGGLYNGSPNIWGC